MKGTGPTSAPPASVQENFRRAVRREHPARVPVAFCISSQYLCRRFGVEFRQYLCDPQTKLRLQCAFQDEHPEALIVPGIYPDFGCGVVEPSAFGCRLVQREDNPLSPEPVCPQALRAQPGEGGLAEATATALSIGAGDFRQAQGLLPQVLEQYEYFWRHLDRKYIERYGYLDGFAFAMGPVETAALVVGYEDFLLGLIDSPGRVHELLDKVSEFTVRWLRAQERLNGTLKRIYLFDHTPARVGPEHFEQFVFPSLARVCGEFPSALKIFHICEPRIGHVVGRLADTGIDVLYFAADLAVVRQAVGTRLCLMGNLNPIQLLLRGTPRGIAAEARACIQAAHSPAGGYVLAPSGAFIPDTPTANIRAVVEAAGSPGPQG